MRSIPARVALGLVGVAVVVGTPHLADHETPRHLFAVYGAISMLGLLACIVSVITE